MRNFTPGAACALLVTVAFHSGCAEKPSAAARAMFERSQAALRGGDFGALYDMMSVEARVQVAAEVKVRAETAAEAGSIASLVLGFDPAEVAKLPPREAYVKMMGAAHEGSSKLGSAAGAGRGGKTGIGAAKVVKCRATAERATVTAELPSGTKAEVKLVREGDEWRLAEPLEAARPTPAGEEVEAGDEGGPNAKPGAAGGKARP